MLPVVCAGPDAQGIPDHCDYPVHDSKLEGISNRIKVVKRGAYGHHDDRCSPLQVDQAFDPEPPALLRRWTFPRAASSP
ncbi:MAG: transposase [Candidatus Brocadiaceae bacterium]|nr:transposase [Candidatus Brocadiaceae bacterium]